MYPALFDYERTRMAAHKLLVRPCVGAAGARGQASSRATAS